jgi:regulator of chromosome condensation
MTWLSSVVRQRWTLVWRKGINIASRFHELHSLHTFINNNYHHPPQIIYRSSLPSTLNLSEHLRFSGEMAPRAATKAASKPTRATATKPAKVVKSVKSTKQTKAKSSLNKVPTIRRHVFVMGDGTAGELGFGAIKRATDVKRPKSNPKLDGAVHMSIGGMHGVALMHDNSILTWGVNDNGALGRNTVWDGRKNDAAEDDEDSDDDDPGLDLNPYESLPTAVPAESFPAGTIFAQVAAGDSASFALTDEGSVYGWGTFRDETGIYGFTLDNHNNIVKEQRTPILIPGLKNIKQISCGENHALALDDKGIVYAWGCGGQSQLGRRLVGRHAHLQLLPTPVALPKTGKIVDICAGPNHSFAIERNGTVWVWGLNNLAQCGMYPYKTEQVEDLVINAPTKLKSLSDVKMMAAGATHSLALTSDGTIMSFGNVQNGCLGHDVGSLPLDDPETIIKDSRSKPRILLVPRAIPSLKAAFVAVGTDHSFALTADGKAYSWGFNTNFQCGLGDTEEVFTPTLIPSKFTKDEKLTWAGCGGQFSMVTSDIAMTDV